MNKPVLSGIDDRDTYTGLHQDYEDANPVTLIESRGNEIPAILPSQRDINLLTTMLVQAIVDKHTDQIFEELNIHNNHTYETFKASMKLSPQEIDHIAKELESSLLTSYIKLQTQRKIEDAFESFDQSREERSMKILYKSLPIGLIIYLYAVLLEGKNNDDTLEAIGGSIFYGPLLLMLFMKMPVFQLKKLHIIIHSFIQKKKLENGTL